jgi:hypothetical protein
MAFGWDDAIIIGASLLGASGADDAADAQAEAAEYNRKLAEQQGFKEAARIRRDGRRDISAIRAGIAKSGVTAQGTPLMVLAESAANIEMDALNSQLFGMQRGDMFRREANAARSAGSYRAASYLLSGLQQIS